MVKEFNPITIYARTFTISLALGLWGGVAVCGHGNGIKFRYYIVYNI